MEKQQGLGWGMGFKKTSSIFALAFAMAASGAAIVEWNGYQPFDKEGGDNPLCDLDRFCRPLTEGEVTLARTVFGDHIDYTHIKLFNRPYMGVVGFFHTVSPNGHIYSHQSSDWAEDYSQTPELEGLFIHEMTHIWQVQQNRNVRVEAMRAYLNHDLDYSKAYAYQIESPVPFAAYNLEQQASIMQDYYLLRRACGNGVSESKAESCALLPFYKDKIGPSFAPAPMV